MQFSGTTTDKGYLHTTSPYEIWLKIPSLAGKWVKVEITEGKGLSNEQRGYHYGCVVPFFQKYWNKQGNNWKKDYVHKLLKGIFFNDKELIDGEWVPVVRSFSGDDVKRAEYAEKIPLMQQWAMEHFGEKLPSPGEQIKFEL